MSDKAWDAVLKQAMATPEGVQIRVRYRITTLLLERRDDVLIAMREIAPSQIDSALLAVQQQRQTNSLRWQILSISQSLYLCDWLRRPTDAGWLAALASARI